MIVWRINWGTTFHWLVEPPNHLITAFQAQPRRSVYRFCISGPYCTRTISATTSSTAVPIKYRRNCSDSVGYIPPWIEEFTVPFSCMGCLGRYKGTFFMDYRLTTGQKLRGGITTRFASFCLPTRDLYNFQTAKEDSVIFGGVFIMLIVMECFLLYNINDRSVYG